MEVLYLLLGISLLVSLIFFVAFVYAVKRGQYDDSTTPAHRILFEDSQSKNNPKLNNNS